MTSIQPPKDLPRDPVALRQAAERSIVSQCINDIHNAGYAITVYDGEEDVVLFSLDHNEVLGAMFTTDEDRLYVIDPATNIVIGWVYFIYGNDGHDVISDYTMNLDALLAPAMLLADQWEERLAR